MNDSIENVNLSSSNSTTKRFNLKSLILVINYFITPFIIAAIILFFLVDRDFPRSIINSPIAIKFFKNNKFILEDEELFINVFTSVVSSITTLITFIIGVLLSRKRTDSISAKKSETTLIKLLILGVGLGIFMILWNIIISQAYRLFGLSFKSENSQGIFRALQYNKILLIINLLFSAPIGEEIVFKYGIFTFFHEIFRDQGKILRIFIPALISAFIFAMIHDGLYLVPLYIVPSFIGCLIYEKTKSLLPCIFGHFINNFIALIMMLTQLTHLF